MRSRFGWPDANSWQCWWGLQVSAVWRAPLLCVGQVDGLSKHQLTHKWCPRLVAQSLTDSWTESSPNLQRANESGTDVAMGACFHVARKPTCSEREMPA